MAATAASAQQQQQQQQQGGLEHDEGSHKTAVGSMVRTARQAREGAMHAANMMWERTKVVRSRFTPKPNGRVTGRQGSFLGKVGLKDGSQRSMVGSQGPNPEEESELIYTSMREMWEDDVFNLPVCKDLPRLVRRICVVDQEDEILFLAPGASAPESTRLRPPKEEESAEGDASGHAEADADADADAELAGAEHVADCDSPNSAESVESSEGTDAAAEDVAEALGREGRRLSKRTSTSKRSSKLLRWSIRRKRDKHVAKDADLTHNTTLAQLIVDFLVVLANHLVEDESEHDDLVAKLRAVPSTVTDSSDLQLVVREIVTLIGPNSRLTRVLKTIHQNIVLHSTVEMKQKLTMKYQTKDVRSAEGWRIVVTLAKGYVQVRHMRREQSLDAFGDVKNHWEFEWELRMTFDARLQNMTAAQLRVTRLILSETMDEELAEELKATLVDGLIVM